MENVNLFIQTCFFVGATICATLVNRLVGDEVLCSKEDIKKWELYPQQIVAELISKNI